MKDRATILCRRRDKILLVTRRWSRWALPGGTIRRTESPHDAALRELAEETTLVVDGLTYLFQFRGLGKRHHIFVTDLPDHLTPKPHNEISACDWFRPEETPTLVTSVSTREIVRLAFRHPDAIMQQAPFGDGSMTDDDDDDDDDEDDDRQEDTSDHIAT
ncbi:NUDIX hydrolase [Paraburkholderia caballeronis]|uniref:NUDIX hydrolase n=1 Tax=Paraburkholderia caballeronis TaxID=416943 RepID=UPI00106690BA|nr:NUDIX domain-containing protein [Paraburkholderia caballeronis]TDV07825.1 8-oxo-dGTP diphosphatase [Paraburkholderia caballeronis]TDV11188.1 8-oxo-dGTP diphosphatase [Paraburkholderia caballeronis]TDV21568.1 8-oxo-dGTP diphosphatase [Paraburkholderia caballeronis]